VHDAINYKTAGMATYEYVNSKVANASPIPAQDANSSTLYLRKWGRYLISVYGYTAQRGTGYATLLGPGVKDSNGNWLKKLPNKKINWHDGQAPQSATMVVQITSGTGTVTGHCDGGVLYMSAIELQ